MTNDLALIGLIAGIVYLVIAIMAVKRWRRIAEQRAQAGEGRVVLNIEEAAPQEGELTADRMHRLAGLCATIGRRVFDEELDFTVGSIARLDRAVVAGWGDRPAEAINPLVLLSVGAYVGEVLVRSTRGRWVSGMSEAEPATILLLAPDDEAVSVSPFLLVREKFEKMYRFDMAIAFTALEQKLKELRVA